MKYTKWQKAFSFVMFLLCFVSFYWIFINKGQSKKFTSFNEFSQNHTSDTLKNDKGMLQADVETKVEADIQTNVESEVVADIQTNVESQVEDDIQANVETELEQTNINDIPSISYDSLPYNSISALSATTIVDTTLLSADYMEHYFYKEEISDSLFKRINRNSYGENCRVPLSDLNYVRVLYYGFDKKTHIGELIVHTKIADDILDILQELYEAKYPIEKMQLVDEYNADDIASMTDNNSSSFNFRVVDGTTTLSKHSLGLAIDINPLYNPYVRMIDGKEVVLPVEGTPYTNRKKVLPYMIEKGDICYQAFINHGFTWGGSWNSSKDYQHFQMSID